MERSTNDILLDSIDRAAFCVQEGRIVRANHAAAQRGICTQTAVADLLGDNQPVYEAFSQGCLYLTIWVNQIPCGTSVTRSQDADVFILDEDISISLQAMALCAQQLRLPMQTVFAVTELLQQDKRHAQHAKELSRGLYQMQRILCNMADTYRYNALTDIHPVSTDLGELFYEITEKAAAMVSDTGTRLEYSGLYETVIGLADRELLERAVYNLVSNAVKFSPKGSTAQASLHRSGTLLRFTIQDEGSSIDPDVLSNVFSRYLRGPGIEDGRHGVGLGMALVRAAAVTHGGTVLIDQPDGKGVRVSMTLQIRQEDASFVRSPVLIPACDYTGGFDHALVELSDILPPESYQNI